MSFYFIFQSWNLIGAARLGDHVSQEQIFEVHYKNHASDIPMSAMG